MWVCGGKLLLAGGDWIVWLWCIPLETFHEELKRSDVLGVFD